MASIYERGPYQFQAVVRIKGARKQTKTFETREAANDWASWCRSRQTPKPVYRSTRSSDDDL